MKILAIESSCDETAAAVVEDGRNVLSNAVSTQIEKHKVFGGVVPEIASRLHTENISAVVEKALNDANLTAVLLGAERQEHDDNFAYVYPEQVEKEKIPKEFLEYIDDLVEHNDLDYKPEAPALDLDSITFQTGIGGGHGFIKEGTLIYDRGDNLRCE